MLDEPGGTHALIDGTRGESPEKFSIQRFDSPFTLFLTLPRLPPLMKRRTICSLLALLLLASLLPLNGCRGGIKALWAKFHHRRAKSKENTTDYADTLASLANSNKLAILRWSNYSEFQAQVKDFYDGRNYELAWTRNGLPTESAKALIEDFANAAQKGLVPADYDADRWPQRVQQLEKISRTHDTSDEAESAIAQFDVAMTVALTRYLSDIHLGPHQSAGAELRHRRAEPAREVRHSNAHRRQLR